MSAVSAWLSYFTINFYGWVGEDVEVRTGLPVEESIKMTEDRDKLRKYIHGVANSQIENRTEQNYSSPGYILEVKCQRSRSYLGSSMRRRRPSCWCCVVDVYIVIAYSQFSVTVQNDYLCNTRSSNSNVCIDLVNPTLLARPALAD